MFRAIMLSAAVVSLAALALFQYLTWTEATAARQAALSAIAKAGEASHAAGLASDRAGIACRASLKAIGKLPESDTVWSTRTVESAARSGFCGGADLDNL